MVSLEKGFEVMSDHRKGNGTALAQELDLNSAADKYEKGEDCVYENVALGDKTIVGLNEDKQPGLSFQHANYGRGKAESPSEKSCSCLPSEYCHVVVGTNYDEDEGSSHSLNEKIVYEREMELQNCNFYDPSAHVKKRTFNTEMETQDFGPSPEFPSMVDVHQGEEMGNNFDMDKSVSPHHDTEMKELISNKAKHVYDRAKSEQEMEVINYQMEKVISSSRLHCADKETENENAYSSNITTDGVKLDVLHFDPDSLHGNPEHSVPPLTVRKTSLSPQRSPGTHQFPGIEEPFFAEGVGGPSNSPRAYRHEHSSSPTRSDLAAGGFSNDQTLPSGMQTSTSQLGSLEGSKHKDDSSLKHVDERNGPRINYSPSKHGRKEMSGSRSPVGQRDSRSHVGQRDSRSPVGRRDSWSPVGQRNSRSPVGQRDSRSPVRRRDSRPPIRRRDSRSPIRRRDSQSPIRRRDSQSPVRRRDARSPTRRRDARSPVRRRDSQSPIRRRYSQSPIRRRDSSSGYRRDYNNRSRSRSPYRRDRYKRSSGKYSPRRRSPVGYLSRRRSPKRRPWSPPPNRSTGLGKPGKILFVAGFSFLTTERELERKFSKFGRVRDIRIVRDKRSGDSRGFGFLTMQKDEEADAAIRALDKTEWNGRIILVEKSKTPGQ